jgi:hypothetical protein
VVKLKDGALYRGTVMELVPGDHVDLRLPSGQTKRFAMADVAYAGPANAATPAAPTTPPPASPATALPPLPPLPTPPAAPPTPKPAPRPSAMKVRFEATPPEAAFFVEAERKNDAGANAVVVEHDLKLVCSRAPCDGVMAPGTYHMGMSLKGSKVVEPEDLVSISAPSTIQGNFTSHKLARIGGWVTLGTGLSVGLNMMLAAAVVNAACNQPDTLNTDGTWTYSGCDHGLIQGLLWGGLGIAAAGAIAGALLVTQSDSVEIILAPLDAAQPILTPSRREGSGPAQSAAAPGFGIVGRF